MVCRRFCFQHTYINLKSSSSENIVLSYHAVRSPGCGGERGTTLRQHVSQFVRLHKEVCLHAVQSKVPGEEGGDIPLGHDVYHL